MILAKNNNFHGICRSRYWYATSNGICSNLDFGCSLWLSFKIKCQYCLEVNFTKKKLFLSVKDFSIEIGLKNCHIKMEQNTKKRGPSKIFWQPQVPPLKAIWPQEPRPPPPPPPRISNYCSYMFQMCVGSGSISRRSRFSVRPKAPKRTEEFVRTRSKSRWVS